MASTQVASLKTLGQIKRGGFQAEEINKRVEDAVPHFVSPRKIVKATAGYRKRCSSFSLTGNSKHHFKRRRKEEFVRPTKFLLGGNSQDPLNLGSLADEKINKALNEHTPKSSPLPTPKHRKEEIEVLIPPNICDPLNLSVPDEDLAERALISPNAVVKRKQSRNRKRRRTNSASEVLDAGRKSIDLDSHTLDIVAPKEAITHNIASDEKSEQVIISTEIKVETASGSKDLKELKFKLDPIRHGRRPPEDKIVSPVVPQPGARKRCGGFFVRSTSKEAPSTKNSNHRSNNASSSGKLVQSKHHEQDSTCNKEVKKFHYGNYNRYYGYRNSECEDLRLRCFRREWFEDKHVLDIGCNAGHVTLCLARDFNPAQIVGIDIDPQLIALARKNVKTYVPSHPHERQFPISMPMMYGPIPSTSCASSYFPRNVSFVQGNYVPENDEFLEMVQPEYDTILCLSVTKWIHLNWGDAGLKRFFLRIYRHLKPGGQLILEAQSWASYSRRKKLTVLIVLPHLITISRTQRAVANELSVISLYAFSYSRGPRWPNFISV